MKYHAILFMCNDEKRARFVIENFKKHNPEIMLTVYNGGSSLPQLKDEYDIIYEEGPNLWQTRTRHPPGSFDVNWFYKLFSTHEKYDPDYLIFLETDVAVNKKIEIEPEYDISGPVTTCGMMEIFMMYDFWGNYLRGAPFEEDRHSKWEHKYHTGMGATALSRNFFLTCKKNLHLIEKCYDMIPMHCYQDVMISLFARYSGCTMGDWKDASDTRGTFRKITEQKWTYEAPNMNCALVHNFKI